MARKFLIARKVGAGATPEDAFRPEHVAGSGLPWAAADCGSHFLASVEGADDALASLAGRPGVEAFPDDLDAPLGAGFARLLSTLEAAGAPTDGLLAASTGRGVAGRLLRTALLVQAGKLASAAPLTARMADVPPRRRNDLAAALRRMGRPDLPVPAAGTWGQALAGAADSLPSQAFAGEVF